MKRVLLSTLFLVLTGCTSALCSDTQPDSQPSLPKIADRVAGLERRSGLLTLYLDEGKGGLLLELRSLGEEFHYLASLRTGLGSLYPRLDRGMVKMGSPALVRFERYGRKVLLVQLNTKFRAVGSKDNEFVRSVEESFANSVLAVFPIVAEDDGHSVLIDVTHFFLSDTFGIRRELQEHGQGEYKLDPARSVVDLRRARAFPKNIEIDVLLTLTAERPGSIVERNAADGRAVTFQAHHSLAALPPTGFRPRAFDTRIGFIHLQFDDHAQPYLRPVEQRWIARWRLEKADPRLPLSPPKQPIIYYLDPAIPEPLRSAVREGALWWNSAFEGAGFEGAIEVRDLPEGIDPMDIRYSVIQWIHRSERGFANGPFVMDPQTGEIIKAMPRLHSDRTRVDATEWAALLEAGITDGDGRCVDDSGIDFLLDAPADRDFVLARIRHLAAHEVGHTLGLEHNFAGSARERSSVMDYPAPLVRIANGRLDLSSAYTVGIGEYDRVAIKYGYSVVPERSEHETLQDIVKQGLEKGLIFIASRDRALHPLASAWDNGADSLETLREALAIRELLLARFDQRILQEGEPVALLRDRFVPVYLYHRFAIESALKLVGGIEFRYAVKGDGTIPVQPIEPARQRAAVNLLLETLRPKSLGIPERLIPLLPPRPYGYGSSAEPFDQLSLVRAVAGFVVRGLLDHERAVRIVTSSDLQTRPLTFDELVGRIVQQTWIAPVNMEAHVALLNRTVQRVVLDALIELALDDKTDSEVRGVVEQHLAQLRDFLSVQTSDDSVVQAHWRLAVRDIEKTLGRDCRHRAKPFVPVLPPAYLTSQ